MAKVAFATDFIELDVIAGVQQTVGHGLGRQVAGYLVIWQTVPIDFSVVDPQADTSREIVLMPSASGKVRLVLL